MRLFSLCVALAAGALAQLGQAQPASSNARRIQGRAVQQCAPTNGQVLAWNSATLRYECATVAGGTGSVTSVAASGGVETTSGAAITATGTIRGAHTVNAQTGTTYTYLDGDRGKLVTHSNAAAIAGTLPQAGAGSAFLAGWFMDVQNLGAGTVTITPATSTIDGAATLALATGSGARISSDGTNYFTQSGVSRAVALGPGGHIVLPGAVYRRVYAGNVASGDTDLYTAPAGKRAVVRGINGQGGANGVYLTPRHKVSGTYYGLNGSNGVSIAPQSADELGFGIVLDPGETFAINSDTTGANVWASVTEFDATVGFRTVKLLSLAAGDNTLYTVPAGKTAYPLYAAGGIAVLGSDRTGTISCNNLSGGTRTYIMYLVPSGGASGATNRISASGTTTTGSLKRAIAPSAGAGDFFVVNTDAATATQFCYMTVAEL